MTRYTQLLADYAQLAGMESAQELLTNQELLVADLTLGLSAEGDEDTGNVLLFTNLGVPAIPQEKQLMQLMLQANAFWVGTGGCTLGIQSATGAVILCTRIPLVQCDAQALVRIIDAFVDVALLWREVVQGRHSLELPALAAI